MSSDPHVKHSTSCACSGTEVVECRRAAVDPVTDGAGLLEHFDEATDRVSFGISGTVCNLADVVLLRLSDGLTYAPDLRDLSASRSPSSDMLSSGAISDCTAVGALLRRAELECVACLLSEDRRLGRMSRDSSAIGSSRVEGGGPPYTYSSVRRRLSSYTRSALSSALSLVRLLLLLCRRDRCRRSLVDVVLELDTADGLAFGTCTDDGGAEYVRRRSFSGKL